MLLSRTQKSSSRKKHSGDKHEKKKKRGVPTLEDFIEARDYTGAITLLEFNKKHKPKEYDELSDLWLGFSYFHNGNYDQSLQLYKDAVEKAGKKPDPRLWVYLGCCQFYMGMHAEARESVLKGDDCNGLQNRLLFHIAHKFTDEQLLMTYHSRLQDVTQDQMCLASIHYLRGHYNEAIDIYKRLFRENKNFLALNVYQGMCYYKLDYHDVSQEVLAIYLNKYPDSAIAINLKACNHFRLYDGRAAETELKRLQELSTPSFKFGQDIVRHNMVVFRNGENALQVLPPLIDVMPEARLNLVIYYLHNEQIQEAFDLMKDVEAISPQEYILKGVVNAAYGQLYKSQDHLKLAQQLFQIVGSSTTECDTIPGRQCMASCLYLLRQFDDVLIYLNSIKSYFYNDNDFNYNYGIAKAACGQYKEAEEALMNVSNEKYKTEFCYLGWLARCYIMNAKPQLAWELYMRMESSNESFNLLNLIGNDCYKMGHFFVAARAFDILERTDNNPEYWDAKRGACIGLFQQIVADEESKELLRDVITILRNTQNPQVDYIVIIMTKWAKQNRVPV